MRILTICRMGTVRSVAMAHVLKVKGFDAIPAGVAANSPETLDMLSKWAELILVMYKPLTRGLNIKFSRKIRITDVGEDVWGNPLHPDLMKLALRFYKGLVKNGDIKE